VRTLQTYREIQALAVEGLDDIDVDGAKHLVARVVELVLGLHEHAVLLAEVVAHDWPAAC
jgi:hypothetical protein